MQVWDSELIKICCCGSTINKKQLTMPVYEESAGQSEIIFEM